MQYYMYDKKNSDRQEIQRCLGQVGDNICPMHKQVM